MHQITIPAPVTVKLMKFDPEGNQVTKEISFQDFFTDNVAILMGKKLRDTRRNIKLIDQLEVCKTGDVWAVEDEDWGRMKTAIDDSDWDQYLARQIISFFDAIDTAPSV